VQDHHSHTIHSITLSVLCSDKSCSHVQDHHLRSIHSIPLSVLNPDNPARVQANHLHPIHFISLSAFHSDSRTRSSLTSYPVHNPVSAVFRVYCCMQYHHLRSIQSISLSVVLYSDSYIFVCELITYKLSIP
jgi:hypothetical protein